LITGGGGLALLIGILLMKIAGASLTPSDWMTGGDAIHRHALYPAILILFLLGAMTKSAQFPFHFWLPNAMCAPTPISAFLHAATMVKAGIYLLMRLHPLMGGTPLWMGSLVMIGGVTALWGAIQALSPCDFKRVLAYTTIMGLGILTMFLGGDNAASMTAAATFLLVHALYKAALFLAVGIIDHQTGTRHCDRLGGLWRAMPLTALAVATATLSMAGFPLFFGFIGKEIMYKGALSQELFPVFATGAALLSNALMTAVAGFLLFRPFFGKRPVNLTSVTEGSWPLLLGPAFMGGLCLLFGLIPGWVSDTLIEPAVHAFHGGGERIQLAIFHGVNTPLLLSIATLTLGAGIYVIRPSLQRWLTSVLLRMPLSGQRVYDAALHGFGRTAAWATGRLQNGSLYSYLLTIVAVFALTTIGVWLKNGAAVGSVSLPQLPLVQWIVVLLMVTAMGVVIASRSRVLSVCALGIVGSGAALVFLIYGAPDLALTQLLVETLTLIIVSLILLRLPPLARPARRAGWVTAANALAAVATGTVIALLSLATTRGPIDLQLTNFFEHHSYLLAHGRNIVNVILVDFRGLDTMGEIIVVATAGLAGAALIARRRR
jgi:multicomponent Na+:H+ antiporter subunit A